MPIVGPNLRPNPNAGKPPAYRPNTTAYRPPGSENGGAISPRVYSGKIGAPSTTDLPKSPIASPHKWGNVEPQRQNNFELSIHGPQGLTAYGSDTVTIDSISLPAQSFDVKDVIANTRKFLVPGYQTPPGAVEITLNTYNVNKSLWLFQKWLDLVESKRLLKDISGEIGVFPLGPDFKRHSTDFALVLQACWVSSIKMGEFNMGSSGEVVKATVTLQVNAISMQKY